MKQTKKINVLFEKDGTKRLEEMIITDVHEGRLYREARKAAEAAKAEAAARQAAVVEESRRMRKFQPKAGKLSTEELEYITTIIRMLRDKDLMVQVELVKTGRGQEPDLVFRPITPNERPFTLDTWFWVKAHGFPEARDAYNYIVGLICSHV